MAQEPPSLDSIAIVGFSIKFPGDADTPEGFWQMLETKQCAFQEWPTDRLNLEAFMSRDSKGFIPGAHFMKEDYGLFDASFFGVSGTEACSMDPQIRILLETAYRALENAGIPMEKAKGSKTAVYTGCMANDYNHIVSRDTDLLPRYTALGASLSMLSNRLSWFFDFHGPSLSVDTACSSSLVALDLACQGLRNGDSDMALVTGANIIAAVEPVLSLTKMSFLSPDGRSFSFDSRANGYGRGEGVGVVVVKRLADAMRDGDTIRAVIRSTGLNQDGYTPGVTQPSKEAQIRLIRDTYDKAGLDFSQTRYVEAHGTGTAVGDPIEAAAIGSVFGGCRSPTEPLYVGAVKSNIGHLEGGSGIAALVKTVLALERGLIPPNANFESLNPDIDAEFLNLKIPTQLTAWPTKGLRRASVASFGYGGSNAHVVLDDAYNFLRDRELSGAHCTVDSPPAVPQTNPSVGSSEQIGEVGTTVLPSQVLVWSTEDEAGIHRMTQAYARYFESLRMSPSEEACFLPRLANTLATRRSQLKWRSFAVTKPGTSVVGDAQKLAFSKPVRIGKELGAGFVFTGQGAQYAGMGVELLRSYPVFRQTMERCDSAFTDLGCQWSLLDALATDRVDINDPAYAQPLTTALQISLVDLLASFGLKPAMVIGHSSGEIAAAYAADGLSLESACKVSYFRGLYASRLMKIGSCGAMLAVDLSEATARPYLDRVREEMGTHEIHIACINSPLNVTISGLREHIDALKSILDTDGVVSHRLRTGVAYHTPQMNQVARDYANACAGLARPATRSRTKPVMISSVTGERIQDLGVLSTPAYWVDNMTNAVLFCAAMENALSQSQMTDQYSTLGGLRRVRVSDWLEVGPHSALQRPFREIVAKHSTADEAPRYASIQNRTASPTVALQTALATLYSHGHAIALDQLNRSDCPSQGFVGPLANLPEYPFNHTKRYWFDSPTSRSTRLRTHKKLELLGAPAPESTSSEAKWRTFFDPVESPWLLDHAASRQPIYPATGMIVMAMEGAKQLAEPSLPISGYYVHDATFVHPIAISTVSRTEAHLHMRPAWNTVDHSSSYEFRVYTEVGGRWEVACRGLLSVQYVSRTGTQHEEITRLHQAQEQGYYRQQLDLMSKGPLQTVSAQTLYECMEKNNLTYGPSFQLLDHIKWNGSDTAVGEIRPFAWTREQSQISPEPHIIHPATLDCINHLGLVSFTKGASQVFTTGLVATRVRGAWISGSGAASPECELLQCHAKVTFQGLRGTESSAFALDQEDRLRLYISSIQTTSVTINYPDYQPVEPRSLCFSLTWEPDVAVSDALPDEADDSRSLCASLDRVLIVFQSDSPFQAQFARQLAGALPTPHQQAVEMRPLHEINHDIPGPGRSLCIFLPELERPLLAEMGPDLFHSLQSFLCQAQEIIWVTAADRSSLLAPRLHIVDGLARVLCTENDQLSFVTSHLEDHHDNPSQWVEHIVQIFRRRIPQWANGPVRELDYQERGGVLHVARVRENKPLNEALLDRTQAPARMRPFGDQQGEGRALTRVVVHPGSLDSDSTVFIEDDTHDSGAGGIQPDEVEIEVKTVGVNLRDVFVLLGKITDERQLGVEGAGIVRRVGSACQTLRPGDRVVATALGTHRTLLRCRQELAVKIPETLSWAVAASIPLAGITAYYALIRLARLQRGESILIHAGAGGTGQMAIQMALHLGARVFTTVGSVEKRDLLQTRYHLPPSQILFSRDTSFQRHIMRLTGNRGVDVVVNSLAGNGLIASWECIAPYGRFIEIGKADAEANSSLPMLPAAQNVSFFVLAVDHMVRTRPALVQDVLQPVMAMVAAGTVVPPWPIQEYSLEATYDAFRLMQSGRNVGKAVIHMDPTAMVPISLRPNSSPAATGRFSADATYIIAGGLGGLGRSAARWMVSMGARWLILLSRSGATSAAAQTLVRELTDQGVQVHTPACDVASRDALSRALSVADGSSAWPPVRGCIHATMVLQDRIFEKLTFAQWTTTLRSKVLTTENLHALLPADLDFFVCLSSLSGVIGNISQANYAAGNTFQDAFAGFRRTIGQRAIALDLGWMAEVGVAAEDEHYIRIQKRIPGMTQVTQTEFHALLARYCGLDLSVSSVDDQHESQLIVGLLTPAQMQAHGVDPPSWLTTRGLFTSLPQTQDVSLPNTSGSAARSATTVDLDWQVAFQRATSDSVAAATGVLNEGLTQKLARALGMAAGEIDPQRSLALQGVDSLLAVELRHWIRRVFSADVSALDITSAAGVEDLAALVMRRRLDGRQK